MALDCLEAELRQALASLHDPDFSPSALLREVTGCGPASDAQCVREAILQALASLRPEPDAPPTARSRRIYDLLSYRYLQALTQEASAERLGITARHLRREQREAVLILARRLLERQESRSLPRDGGLPPGQTDENDELAAWREQVRQELAALQQCAPDSATDIREALRGAVMVEKARAEKCGVTVETADVPPGLTAAIHPSLLRQVLVAVLEQMTSHAPGGQISVEAKPRGDRVVITLTARPIAGDVVFDTCLVEEILATQDGTLELSADGDSRGLSLSLMAADEVKVLVVDDNLDLVHFYRRYTAGSHYRIVHMPLGENVLAAVTASAPGVIVLDVMLPDVDGWELLAQLHEHPATRCVPVVVCSVIREQELALDLGAVLYLPKPVRRAEFLDALDRAVTIAHGWGVGQPKPG